MPLPARARPALRHLSPRWPGLANISASVAAPARPEASLLVRLPRFTAPNARVVGPAETPITPPTRHRVPGPEPEDLPAPDRFSFPPSRSGLANGNTIIRCRRGNSQRPQRVEVTPANAALRVRRTRARPGPATGRQPLHDPGRPENPGATES